MAECGEELRRTIGFADCLELLSLCFGFPTRELANALVDGRLREDAVGCFADAGIGGAGAARVADSLVRFEGMSPEEVFHGLRQSFSLLFLSPNRDGVRVFAYESAFRYRASGKPGTPVLFRSSCSIDVERQMREASVIPNNARTEPVDSIWNELSFLSYLLGRIGSFEYGQCLGHAAPSGSVQSWDEKLQRFLSSHFLAWAPEFFDMVAHEAASIEGASFYADMARIGALTIVSIGSLASSSRDLPAGSN